MKPTPAATDALSEGLRQHALDWFVRLHADEVGEATQSAFEAWLDADPRHLQAYQQVARNWADPALALALQLEAPQIPVAAGRRTRRAPRWAMAASLLLAAGLLTAGWTSSLMADQRTAIGERRALMLEDGSELMLDSESAVDIVYTPTLRTVKLIAGRVFLSVQHDPQRPLLVRAGDATVRVIGTRFSVARDGDAVSVAVQNGRVGVHPDADTPVQILAGGEGLRISSTGAQRYAVADTGDFAWMRGRLVFSDRPLHEVLDELDRYFPGRIVLINEQAAAVHVSGSFSLDDPRAAAAQLAHVAGARAISLGSRMLLIR